ESEVEDQLRADAVVILNEQAAERAATLGVLTATLDEAVDGAEKEIGARIAAVTIPPETVVAVLPEGIDQVHLHLHKIAADGNLMAADDPVDAIAEVKILPVEVARVAGAETVVPGYCKYNFGRRGVGDRNA